MTETIIKHLMTRPLAPILKGSVEKDSENALKMMTVLDYYVQKYSLYKYINAVPNLFEQLFNFKSYATFQCYKYILEESLRRKLLKCDHCDFLSTYEITITHMALNHDRHVNIRFCQWCKRTDLKTHERFNNFQDCYSEYGKSNLDLAKGWHINKYLSINRRFYNVVCQIAEKLGVLIQRSRNSTRTVEENIETIELDDDDEEKNNDELFSDITLWRSPKTINLDALEELFKEAMHYFWTKNNTIIIDDDDDDDVVDDISAKEGHSKDQENSLHTLNNSIILTPPLRPIPILTQIPHPEPVTNDELTKLTSFVFSTINNIHDEKIKRQTLKRLGQVIIHASAEDMNTHFQMDGIL